MGTDRVHPVRGEAEGQGALLPTTGISTGPGQNGAAVQRFHSHQLETAAREGREVRLRSGPGPCCPACAAEHWREGLVHPGRVISEEVKAVGQIGVQGSAVPGRQEEV